MTANWVFVLLYASALLLLVAERSLAHPWRGEIGTRWLTNAGLFLLAALTAGVLVPGGITSLAAPVVPESPAVLGLEVLGVVLLRDFLGYWQHRLFHAVPLFWRAHRVHHSDQHVDVTTAHRHHPIEVAIATALAAALVIAIGMSLASLTIALLIANLASFYTHTSLDLPRTWDRQLRKVFVTPAVHRLHHSCRQAQTDSNFGTVLTLWDRLFTTHRDPEADPVERLGLDDFRGADEDTLVAALTQPLRNPPQPLPAAVTKQEPV